MSYKEPKEKEKDKCGIMLKKKKKPVTIYKCDCAFSPTAIEIFKRSLDLNTMEGLNVLHNISEFLETI